MSVGPDRKASWRGLFGCLLLGVFAVAALVAVVTHFHRRHAATEARIDSEFLQPWAAAVRDGRVGTAWDTLTTAGYRSGRPRSAVEATWSAASARFGTLSAVDATSVTATTQLGAGRSFQQGVTRWRWSSGAEFFLTLELVDVSGTGFRLEAARPGGRNSPIQPPGLPDGPW